MAGWRSIPCSRRRLRLDVVLPCGQSFRWQELQSGEWEGVFANRLWHLKQDDNFLFFKVLNTKNIREEGNESFLREGDGETEKCKKEQNVDRSFSCSRTSLVDKNATNTCTRANFKREVQDNHITQELTCTNAQFNNEVKDNHIKEELTDREDVAASILHDYFQLGVDMNSLYSHWSSVDSYFHQTALDFWGIRILRQDPVENLFSFICSTNNNIKRISGMVEKLCSNYGQPVAEMEGKVFHSFPSATSLAQAGVEEALRSQGFGYRAKFIARTAQQLVAFGEDWLPSLRQQSYAAARQQLLQLSGVGGKVADCVCLMSLDKPEAVPVDTHVWQFTARNYMPHHRSVKNLNEKLYKEIGDHFRALWGDHAGWAQTVLFAAELPQMQSKKVFGLSHTKLTGITAVSFLKV